MAKDTTSTKKSAPHGSKWYLNKSVGSLDEGVYFASEVREMPDSTRKHIQSLSSAIREGLVDGDMSSGGDINDIKLYGPFDHEGKNKKLRGVEEGHFEKFNSKAYSANAQKSESTKIGNKLRDKLTGAAADSQENSIKAQIAAKKAQQNSFHPSDSGQ